MNYYDPEDYINWLNSAKNDFIFHSFQYYLRTPSHYLHREKYEDYIDRIISNFNKEIKRLNDIYRYSNP